MVPGEVIERLIKSISTSSPVVAEVLALLSFFRWIPGSMSLGGSCPRSGESHGDGKEEEFGKDV